MNFNELNDQRRQEYRKSAGTEYCIEDLNDLLYQFYSGSNESLTAPYIFVFGLPRSGTTLLAQLIGYYTNASYINNIMARFWLSPLHGIAMSRSILGEIESTTLKSDYATTPDIVGLHEFGYFWRHHLNIEHPEDQWHSTPVDWTELISTLVDIQRTFDTPVVMKNLFGVPWYSELKEKLGDVIFVRIERDPLDVAISILDARRKFYRDDRNWWSIAPPEYPQLKDLDTYEQIAGQIYYLNKHYDRISEEVGTINIPYYDLCWQTNSIINYITDLAVLEKTIKIDNLDYSAYPDRGDDKAHFQFLFDQLEENDNG